MQAVSKIERDRDDILVDRDEWRAGRGWRALAAVDGENQKKHHRPDV
jgi:hypothetical protein